MSNWTIFGNVAISDTGETIQTISDTMSISSSGVTYQSVGNMMVGSDGSSYQQMGDSFSSDGSTRLGSFTTGIGAIFTKKPRED
jgi:hypothetical protein